MTKKVTLPRKLNLRMLRMITIGGSIGTGIFLASGNALYLAGPGGTMLAYLVTGIMAYFLMTSLGEMAAYAPDTGSLYTYAANYVDPALGYALGWNYWYSWAITVASEISAAAVVMDFWFPNTSPLIWCVPFLIMVVGLNAYSAKLFGEAEYWFSLIKVIVIVSFIIAGFALIFGATDFKPVGFKNWTSGDAPFHGGLLTIFSAFMIAGFSFQGTELLGIAAGESENPEKDVPKAVKQVFWRILIFFILTVFVISMLIPHHATQLTDTSVSMSPFTLVFSQYGITYAAMFINMIILIAIISTANSGMYASTRLMWHMASAGHLPSLFSKLTKRGVPIYALLATTLVATFAFLSSLYGSGTVYLWLVNAGSLSGFIAWLGISVSHYRFRLAYQKQGKDLNDLPYLAKGYPYGTLFVALLCVIIIAGQNYQLFLSEHIDWHGAFLSYLGLPVFLCLWFGYKWRHRTKVVNLLECNLEKNLVIARVLRKEIPRYARDDREASQPRLA